MRGFSVGHDRYTGDPIRLPRKSFDTHYHLIGGTGKGKTTAIHTILQPLISDPVDEAAVFLWDRLGGFSSDLLAWMASDYCPQDVRDRLVYIEPAREDRILGFNPLLYDTPAHGYYRVSRATEIILRAWESVNIEAMPRLARWTFNAFWATAQLGLTIADSSHLLFPGSDHHEAVLRALPQRLQAEWAEIRSARSDEALRALDSSRNRLKPYFESDILRRMFGTTRSHLDVEQFMREKKIVLINLAPRNRLASQLADTIGSLILNEVLATARSLPRDVHYPAYLVLDEFQNFVGPDIEAALPEVRQLGLKLILSHQSLSQLKRGDYDLTSMIFQAQSRMIFGVQGEDAGLLAEELASLTFDSMKVKDEIYSRRQLVTGHRIAELQSHSNSQAYSDQWRRDFGSDWSANSGTSRDLHDLNVGRAAQGRTTGGSTREGRGGGRTDTSSSGTHETLVPEYDQFMELSSRTYLSFDEQRHLWAQLVRTLRTGESILRLVDDPTLYEVIVKRSTPGHLAWSPAEIAAELPEEIDAVEALIEQNFASDLFLSPETIDREGERRLQAVLYPRITLETPAADQGDHADDTTADDLFA